MYRLACRARQHDSSFIILIPPYCGRSSIGGDDGGGAERAGAVARIDRPSAAAAATAAAAAAAAAVAAEAATANLNVLVLIYIKFLLLELMLPLAAASASELPPAVLLLAVVG